MLHEFEPLPAYTEREQTKPYKPHPYPWRRGHHGRVVRTISFYATDEKNGRPTVNGDGFYWCQKFGIVAGESKRKSLITQKGLELYNHLRSRGEYRGQKFAAAERCSKCTHLAPVGRAECWACCPKDWDA